jgi:tetratricopeptide (TPR) repeat protein
VEPTSAAVRELIDEASRSLDRLQQRFPNDLRGVCLAAQLRYRFGERDQALQLWQRCLTADPQDIQARVSVGRILMESGDLARAEPLLRSALAASPGNPQAAFILATALIQQGKLRDAVGFLKTSIEADPQLMPNRVLLGQAYLQQQEYAPAKECFLAATRLAPEYPNAYFGLATACARLGQKAEAAQYRQRLKELQAKDLRSRIEQSQHQDDLQSARGSVAEAFVSIGRLYREHGDEAAAEESWNRALELDPRDMASRAELARLYEGRGQPREVLRVLLPLQTTRADDASLWFRLGQAHAQCAELAEAEAALRHVVQLAPQRAPGYAALAELCLKSQGRAQEAVAFAREAVQREPTAANYALLSAACEQSNDAAAALAAIEAALQREPGNPQYQRRYIAMKTRGDR